MPPIARTRLQENGRAGRAGLPRKTGAKGGLLYIIQKHDASRLHYDFRLELDGVLKSWAIPKGPSLDPSAKRLAVEVEDHPLEYGSFEGLIPQGEYGGGTVMLWDRGSWEPEEDPHEGLKTGKLKFTLHGEKLHGSWALIRKAPIDSGRGPVKNQWLLIKHRDEAARDHDEFDVTAAETKSVASGRDLDEIAGDGDRVWSSKNGEQKVKAAKARKSAEEDHKGSRKAAARKLSAKTAAKGKASRGGTKKVAQSRRRRACPSTFKSNWPRSWKLRPRERSGFTRSNSTATGCWRSSTDRTSAGKRGMISIGPLDSLN